MNAFNIPYCPFNFNLDKYIFQKTSVYATYTVSTQNHTVVHDIAALYVISDYYDMTYFTLTVRKDKSFDLSEILGDYSISKTGAAITMKNNMNGNRAITIIYEFDII